MGIEGTTVAYDDALEDIAGGYAAEDAAQTSSKPSTPQATAPTTAFDAGMMPGATVPTTEDAAGPGATTAPPSTTSGVFWRLYDNAERPEGVDSATFSGLAVAAAAACAVGLLTVLALRARARPWPRPPSALWPGEEALLEVRWQGLQQAEEAAVASPKAAGHARGGLE